MSGFTIFPMVRRAAMMLGLALGMTTLGAREAPGLYGSGVQAGRSSAV